MKAINCKTPKKLCEINMELQITNCCGKGTILREFFLKGYFYENSDWIVQSLERELENEKD